MGHLSFLHVGQTSIWGALILLLGLSMAANAAGPLKVPTATDNQGMNKYERLNKIEQDTIKMAEGFNEQAKIQQQLLQNLQEQNTKLMAEVHKLQNDLSSLEQNLKQQINELKKSLPPPPPPTPTRVPTANI